MTLPFSNLVKLSLGKYVIVAVGDKSFNGRILMGQLYTNGSVTIGAHSCTALRGDAEKLEHAYTCKNSLSSLPKLDLLLALPYFWRL